MLSLFAFTKAVWMCNDGIDEEVISRLVSTLPLLNLESCPKKKCTVTPRVDASSTSKEKKNVVLCTGCWDFQPNLCDYDMVSLCLTIQKLA